MKTNLLIIILLINVDTFYGPNGLSRVWFLYENRQPNWFPKQHQLGAVMFVASFKIDDGVKINVDNYYKFFETNSFWVVQVKSKNFKVKGILI